MQLERLNDETLTKEEMKLEFKKATAISQVSEQIIDNAKISLEAAKLVSQHGGDRFFELLPEVEGKPKALDYSK